MPRRKKQPSEMTTEEAMKFLFPKPVRDKAREVAESEAKPQVRGENVSIKKETT